MASWDPGQRTRYPHAFVALLVMAVVIACLAIASHVEATSLNPDTGCRQTEILTAAGECR